jgi:nitroimidazol reductase NimA-like FMN-containing flavoprotein (pyridoxamine 5'-phosphate oxidase superfamily)
MSREPEFRVLDQGACEALLAACSVGRLAFSHQQRVDVEPVHYVFRDGWIFGRTQRGTKVTQLAHRPWVAFEVDVVRALFDWESVVVHGRVEFPDPADGPRERELHAKAVTAFRTLVPAAFTAEDPTPARTLVFAISVQELSGRAASPPAAPSEPPSADAS